MGIMCPTGLSRPGGWWRTHPGSHLGERFNDASAGMFQRTPALCLCCSHVSPHSGLVLWFPKFLAMFDIAQVRGYICPLLFAFANITLVSWSRIGRGDVITGRFALYIKVVDKTWGTGT